MYKWVSESEVSTRLGYKILLAGLSEAGKTAVKRIFFLKQETKDVSSLSATINYERLTIKIRDIPITIVDLGGQKIFLKRFLNNYSPFVFSSVKALIFLIDVANRTTRNNSIQYFASCLEKLQTFSPDAEIFVFLHKNDLVRNLPNYESIHTQLKEQFQGEYPKRLRFFRTTIYTPETVINSFGRIFELSMPELAKSELVDKRVIGQVEEFSKKYVAPIEREVEVIEKPQKVISSTTPSDTPTMTVADPVLEKLQFLVSDGLKAPSSSTSSDSFISTPSVYDAVIEEKDSEKILTHIEPNGEAIPNELDRIIDSTDSSIEETSQFNKLVSHIIDFYGVSIDDAIGIVKSDYSTVFEIAVKTGIPITIVVDVILKYIPFIKSKGLHIDTLTTNRLLEFFLAFLSGSVKDDELKDVLVYAVEQPEMPIEEIARKYLTQQVEPKIKREKKEPFEFIRISVPIDTELDDNIITIPDIKGLGFKAELIEENVVLTFYVEDRPAGKATVPPTITIDEIMYLLAFEMNLKSLGVLEEGTHSINFVARVIHEALRIFREEKTEEITPLAKEKVQFIIPQEIQLEQDYLLIPGSQGVAFKLEKDQEEFLIRFTQRGFPIAQTIIQKNISIQELISLMTIKFQLPFESDYVAHSTARILRCMLDMYLEERPSLPLKTVLTSPKEKIDSTSEELKSFLDLLNGD